MCVIEVVACISLTDIVLCLKWLEKGNSSWWFICMEIGKYLSRLPLLCLLKWKHNYCATSSPEIESLRRKTWERKFKKESLNAFQFFHKYGTEWKNYEEYLITANSLDASACVNEDVIFFFNLECRKLLAREARESEENKQHTRIGSWMVEWTVKM